MGEFTDLQQFLVSVVVPLAIVLAPRVAERLKEAQRERIDKLETERKDRMLDHEIGAKLRDELRRDVDRLKEEVDVCEEDRKSLRGEIDAVRTRMAGLQEQITRLEHSQRRGEPDAFRAVA